MRADVTTGAGTQPRQHSTKSSFGAKQWIATILTLLVIVFVFAVVFPSLGDYSQAWTAIQGMSSGWVIALIAITVGVVVIYPMPLIRALPSIAYRAAFAVRQTSFMIANVIPGGGAIGLGVQYGMLNTYGFSSARAADAVGITSVSNTVVTLALPIVSLVGLVLIGEASSTAVIVAIIGAVLVGIIVGVIAVVLRSEEAARKVGDWLDKIVSRIFGWFHKSFNVDLASDLVEFRASLLSVGTRRILIVTGSNLVQQLSGFLVLFVAILAIQGPGGSVNIAEALAAYSVARLATFIPIPPGGLGTSDAIMTGLLTNQFGMASSDAMAAVLIWRAATYFPQVLIGIGTLIWWRRKQAKIARTAT
jgi:uncharacterized protein (TIRG00374 family)